MQQQQGYPQQQQAYPQMQQQQGYPQMQQQQGYPPMQQQQVYPPAGQQATVIIQPGGANQQYEGCCSGQAQTFKSSTSLGLGIAQILIGVLCIILNSIGLNMSISFWSAYAIWPGILFIITGAFGAASKSKNKCLVVTFMVFCILSAIFVVEVIAYAGIGVGLHSATPIVYGYGGYGYRVEQSKGPLAIHAVILILGLGEFAIAIWSAVICGQVACCQNTRGTVLGTPMQTNYPVPPANNAQPGAVAQPPSYDNNAYAAPAGTPMKN